MAVTPGSKSKLNTVKGVSAILSITDAEKTALSTKVLPANILVKEDDGKVYLTDGTAAISGLKVLVDQVLTTAEKTALNAAFSTGSYVAAAGGVVVHDTNGKIADSSLNVVADGKIVPSYLSDYIGPDGKVLVEALPDTARAGVKYVATYADLNSLSDEEKKALVFVIDATGDATVTKGSAMYVWQNAAWLKIAETESLDIDVDAIKCDYDNVQATGAVMYDHPVFVEAPTATELTTLMDASASA